MSVSRLLVTIAAAPLSVLALALTAPTLTTPHEDGSRPEAPRTGLSDPGGDAENVAPLPTGHLPRAGHADGIVSLTRSPSGSLVRPLQ
jgi:hypothetical protein